MYLFYSAGLTFFIYTVGALRPQRSKPHRGINPQEKLENKCCELRTT
jgi:hypothetical protein